MARYYQTAQPQFVQDFVYTPPYELMDKLASTRQASYDNALAQAKLFDKLQIQHLNSEDDAYNAAEIQKYYMDSANNIAKTIQGDKLNVNAYLGQIDALSKELTKDMTTGNIAKLQNSYAALQQWEKDNEHRKKDKPDRYQAGKNYFMQKRLESGGNSLNKQWSGELITKDVDWNKLAESVKNIQANEWVEQSAGAGGGYIYKNKKTGEEVEAGRIKEYIMGQLLMDPSNIAALRQSQQFGLGKYFNDEDQLDFNAPGLLGVNMYSNAASYKKTGVEQDMQSDGTYIAQQRLAFDYAELEYRKQKEARDREYDQTKDKKAKIDSVRLAMIDAQSEGTPEGNRKYDLLATELATLEGTTMGAGTQFGSLYGTWQDVLTAANKGDKTAVSIRNSQEQQIRKELKLGNNPKDLQFIRELSAKMHSGAVNEKGLSDFVQGYMKKNYGNSASTVIGKNLSLGEGLVPLATQQTRIATYNNKIQSTQEYLKALQKGDPVKNKERIAKAQQDLKKLQGDFTKEKASWKSSLSTAPVDKKSADIANRAKALVALGKKYIDRTSTNWEEQKNQDTFMEFAPVSVSASAITANEINQAMVNDKVEGSAFTFYEVGGGVMDKPVKVASVKAIDVANRFGGNSFLVTDTEGKDYIMRGNNNYSPVVNKVANTAVNGITNKDAFENYHFAVNPVSRELKTKINALTAKNTNGGKFSINIPVGGTSKKLDVVFNPRGEVQIYDGPVPMFSAPADVLNAGIAVQKEYKLN